MAQAASLGGGRLQLRLHRYFPLEPGRYLPAANRLLRTGFPGGRRRRFSPKEAGPGSFPRADSLDKFGAKG